MHTDYLIKAIPLFSSMTHRVHTTVEKTWQSNGGGLEYKDTNVKGTVPTSSWTSSRLSHLPLNQNPSKQAKPSWSCFWSYCYYLYVLVTLILISHISGWGMCAYYLFSPCSAPSSASCVPLSPRCLSYPLHPNHGGRFSCSCMGNDFLRFKPTLFGFIQLLGQVNFCIPITLFTKHLCDVTFEFGHGHFITRWWLAGIFLRMHKLPFRKQHLAICDADTASITKLNCITIRIKTENHCQRW